MMNLAAFGGEVYFERILQSEIGDNSKSNSSKRLKFGMQIAGGRAA